MMQIFKCPACGATLNYENQTAATVICQFCNSTLIVPPELRGQVRAPQAPAPFGAPENLREAEPALSVEELQEIQRLVSLGQKIDAIKLLRQNTRLGLKEAKDAIEAMERGEAMLFAGAAATTPRLPNADLDSNANTQLNEILTLARTGQKIEAIKLFRETFDTGLKEAKDAVEAMESGHAPADALRTARATAKLAQFSSTLKNNPPPTARRPQRGWSLSGCAGGILLVGFVLAMVFGAPFRLSGSYQQALDAANADPTAIAALGSPIQPRWLPIFGKLSCGNVCSANYNIPVYGPNGTGTIRVFSDSEDSFIGFGGTWDLGAYVIVNEASIAELRSTATPTPTPNPAEVEATQAVRRAATTEAEMTQGAIFLATAEVVAEATATAEADEVVNAQATRQASAVIQKAVAAAVNWPVVVSDTFDNNNYQWPADLTRDNSLSVDAQVTEGVYAWTVNVRSGNSYLNLIPHSSAQFDAFYAAVDIKMLGGDEGHYAYGLVVRHLDDDYAFFGVLSDGRYRVLTVFGSGIYQTLEGQSPAIKPRGLNRLVVYALGSDFVFEINGKVICVVNEEFVPGDIGLGIDTLERGDETQVEFDNFVIRAP